MIGEDELRRQLLCAAEEFPVRGCPRDVQRRVVRRRRVTAGLALAFGVMIAAAVAVAVPMVSGSSPGPARGAPLTATPGTDYVGGSWRLTSVAEGAKTITIPADIGAQMDLLPDGQILVNDGVNTLSGRFTKSADGFEVRDVITTLVVYGGRDPHRLAAIAALDTLALGHPGQSSRARDTVLSADQTRLVVQAGAFRLTFEQAGPAPTPDPHAASTTPG